MGRVSASSAARTSRSTSTFQPCSTVSTHSVVSRRVAHGVPSRYASFCTPPESVRIARAPRASVRKSRYPSGGGGGGGGGGGRGGGGGAAAAAPPPLGRSARLPRAALACAGGGGRRSAAE